MKTKTDPSKVNGKSVCVGAISKDTCSNADEIVVSAFAYTLTISWLAYVVGARVRVATNDVSVEHWNDEMLFTGILVKRVKSLFSFATCSSNITLPKLLRPIHRELLIFVSNACQYQSLNCLTRFVPVAVRGVWSPRTLFIDQSIVCVIPVHICGLRSAVLHIVYIIISCDELTIEMRRVINVRRQPFSIIFIHATPAFAHSVVARLNNTGVVACYAVIAAIRTCACASVRQQSAIYIHSFVHTRALQHRCVLCARAFPSHFLAIN